jgi:Ca2+-binding RTX toxin-like protein
MASLMAFACTTGDAAAGSPAQPGVNVSKKSNLLTAENGADVTVATLTLATQPAADVSVALSSGDVSEGIVTPGSLTFTPANYDVAQAFTVVGVDDTVDDGNVAYAAGIGPTSSSDPDYDGIDPADLSVINIDNEGPIVQPSTVGFLLASSNVAESKEATIVVRLTKPSDLPVTVTYRSGPGGAAIPGVDFDLAPGELVFAPGQTQRSFVVRITDDILTESNETIRLRLDQGPKFGRLGRSAHTLTILDDDPIGRCRGKTATPGVTRNGDTIFGTPEDDVILGATGVRRIHGLGGADTICRADGGDVIFGGDGDDVIVGSEDGDELRGGPGRDVLLGRGGGDRLYGVAGVDRLVGGPGDDELFGQGEDDIVVGGEGDDLLRGGVGADSLFGRGGNDRLHGGAGRPDVCNGGPGADQRLALSGCEETFSIP